ncbi:MAG: DUF4403 family protein [Sphingobium sp.]|nr:DUF4403 family protein [Sphingobium sp.]
MRDSYRNIAFCSVITMGLLLAACGKKEQIEPPVRSSDKAPVPQYSSTIALPIEADQKILITMLEQEIPRTLWTINQHSSRCVAPQKVKILGKQLNVTPPISCTIIGEVTRGPIRLRGSGKEIIADIPLHATISARDVGGILKGETATGVAMARAYVTLDIRPDWTPTGTVRLHYDWKEAPGIDFLGQRITFTDQADEKLQPIRRRLEQQLPRELSKINFRPQIEQVWQQSFTSLLLNEKNPPVWMRLTPERLIYEDYALGGGKLRLKLALQAKTETFIGDRPQKTDAAALPPLAKGKTDGKLNFFIPVLADYAQLEPVILKALVKRSARPFNLPVLGSVAARFEEITAYGTHGGHIAVGIRLAAWPVSGNVKETKGLVWLTARPFNAAGSPKIEFHDMKVAGDSDGIGGDLLLQLVSDPVISAEIGSSLTQNFSNDLDKLLVKIRGAIGAVREGDFVMNGVISDYQLGEVKAYGNGLYLPVQVKGNAKAHYRPARNALR